MPAELILGFILIVLCCLYGYTSRQRWLDVARIHGWNLAVEIWKNTGELPDKNSLTGLSLKNRIDSYEKS